MLAPPAAQSDAGRQQLQQQVTSGEQAQSAADRWRLEREAAAAEAARSWSYSDAAAREHGREAVGAAAWSGSETSSSGVDSGDVPRDEGAKLQPPGGAPPPLPPPPPPPRPLLSIYHTENKFF